MLEKLTSCPICKTEHFTQLLNCKDYTVSQEVFNIVKCKHCGFLFTNPRPDQDSITQYYQSESYISHSDTRRGLVNQIYHIVRKRALQQKLKLVNSLHQSRLVGASNQPKYLLDYGCGTGAFLHTCQQNHWKVAGVEPDEGARQLAEKQIGSGIYETIFNQVFSGQSFDIITLWHVLEHIHQLHETVQGLKALLKPEGTLVIAVPNHQSYEAGVYQQYWAAYDVPRHLYHFTPHTMRLLVEGHQMQIKGYLPMYYDAYYVSLLSEQYKHGKNNFLNAFWRAYQSNLKARKSQDYSSLIYLVAQK